MKRTILSSSLLAAFCLLLSATFIHAQTTLSGTDIPRTISYQGKLTNADGSSLINGTYTITVALYADPNGAKKVWQDSYSATLTDGIFNLYLGSGTSPLPDPAVMNAPLWIATRVGDSPEMFPLTPLSASPYALNISNGAITTGKLADGAVTAEKVKMDYISGVEINDRKVAGVGTVLKLKSSEDITLNYDEATNSVTIASNRDAQSGTTGDPEKGASTQDAVYGTTNWLGRDPGFGGGNEPFFQFPYGAYNTLAGGYLNTIAPYGNNNFIGGGNDNSISNSFSVIGGGSANSISNASATISGGSTNSITGAVSTIGGGSNNVISDSYGTIAGGGENEITERYGSIGGGSQNTVDAEAGTIAGGSKNAILTYADHAVIGGGDSNIVDGSAFAATIGGGQFNMANGATGTIGGGVGNQVDIGSTVAGGFHNSALYSYATVGGGVANNATDYTSTVSGGQANTASEQAAFIGGGVLNTASGIAAVVAGGSANSATADGATVAGGYGNLAQGAYSMIGGGSENVINTNSSYGTIGGGESNRIDSNVLYGTIGGGQANIIIDPYSYGTIGGGLHDTVEGTGGTVAGGIDNFARNYASVGGGSDNKATSSYSTIAGGYHNAASSFWTTVGGGYQNTANLSFATVAGGDQNTAGNSAFAGGGYQNTAAANYSAIGGGYRNTANGNTSTIPGGDNLQTTGYGQTAVGYFNASRGFMVSRPNAAGTAATDDPLFMVGNGDGVSKPNVPSNAFEVSYNGHSVVYGTNGVGTIRPAIRGATFIDNIIYAWGDINGNGTTNSQFGIGAVAHILGSGIYTVTVKIVDPQTGTPITLTNASITATIVESDIEPEASCAILTTTRIGNPAANQFIIRTKDLSCRPMDAAFMFKVTGRP